MGKWKFYGGQKWDGEEFIPNGCLDYDLVNEPDRAFQLSPGDLLTPGLVDFHVHIWAPPGTVETQLTDQLLASKGILACGDGGTFGCDSWEAADRFWRNAYITEIRSMLNIRSEGLAVYPVPKVSVAEEVKIDKAVELFKNAQGRILGFKVCLGMSEDKKGDEAILNVARKAADRAGTRIAVHLTNTFLSPGVIASYLKPGDFILHPFHEERGNMLSEDGTYSKVILELKERGVLVDVAAGRAHLSWKVTKAALKEGFIPDIISTDGSRFSWQKPPFRDLTHLFSAFVTGLKLPLNDTFKAVSSTPARFMGIRSNMDENLVLLKKKEGLIQFADGKGELVEGDYEYIPTIVILKGKALVANSSK